ncbi:MAG: hypothetical protein QGI83_16295 [Candidatus Latescibacteria bacterium]|jgi:hypothetical protein|nr:hypothetical protein [Candidatus Latescibacterota bacterium]
MNRDSILFAGFILLFAIVNGVLLASGAAPVSWDGLGVIVAAGLTLALYSFLYQDNPLFKLAEHVYVGIAAGYTFGQIWYPTLYGEIVGPLLGAGPDPRGMDWWLIAPTLLGILMLTRFSRRIGWLSRIAFAFVVGLGAGLTIPRFISANILAQVRPSLSPITWSMEGLGLVVILAGVVSVLIYFFFSVEHTGPVGVVSRVGIWFLMVSFGASFGYTIMGRLSLLIGRVGFLLEEWLRLDLPLF